ncbi:hypothetical protein GCM10009678_55970 [Actinomadura kijaniata]
MPRVPPVRPEPAVPGTVGRDGSGPRERDTRDGAGEVGAICQADPVFIEAMLTAPPTTPVTNAPVTGLGGWTPSFRSPPPLAPAGGTYPVAGSGGRAGAMPQVSQNPSSRTAPEHPVCAHRVIADSPPPSPAP